MRRVSAANRARDIAREVASYRPDLDVVRPRIKRELDFRYVRSIGRGSVVDQWRTIGNLAFTAFSHSHAVMRLAEQPIEPRGSLSVLTRRTLAATAVAGTPHKPMFEAMLDECCMAAELKFVHALEYHESKRSPQSNHAAGLVLHDVTGEPVAYQKAIGEANAYVWQDGILLTEAGPRQVFAGSIIEPQYRDKRSTPQRRFAGAGLVGIAGCVAVDIAFKRFSLETLPRAVRTGALLDTTIPDAYAEYRGQVDKAASMNAAMFGERLTALTNNIQTFEIDEPLAV